MKLFFLILGLLISFGSWSQADTTCIKTRWIVLKNTNQNEVLFKPETSIIKTIRDQTHEFKLLPYHPENSKFEYRPYRPSPLGVHRSNYIDYVYLDSSEHVVVIYAQSDVPFVDDYGDPLTTTDDDGDTIFLYEEPIRYIVDLDEICEIRIQEDKNSTEFEATKIGFYALVNFKVTEIFWVNLTQLSRNLTDPTTYPWYSFIKNNQYSGFQYMQTSCYDDLIRY